MALGSRPPDYPTCVPTIQSPSGSHTRPRTASPAFKEPVPSSEVQPSRWADDCSHTCTRSMPTNHRKFRWCASCFRYWPKVMLAASLQPAKSSSPHRLQGRGESPMGHSCPPPQASHPSARALSVDITLKRVLAGTRRAGPGHSPAIRSQG